MLGICGPQQHRWGAVHPAYALPWPLLPAPHHRLHTWLRWHSRGGQRHTTGCTPGCAGTPVVATARQDRGRTQHAAGRALRDCVQAINQRSCRSQPSITSWTGCSNACEEGRPRHGSVLRRKPGSASQQPCHCSKLRGSPARECKVPHPSGPLWKACGAQHAGTQQSEGRWNFTC